MFYKGSAISGSGGGSGDAVWGAITGTLSDQTDLADALAAKQDLIDSTHKLSASLVDGLATVATTGAYSDLSGKPTIPTVPENDNTTISLNAQDKLQAIGAIDKNSGSALGFWHGTQAQYNAGGNVKATYYNWDNNDTTSITFPEPNANDYRDIVYGNGTWLTCGDYATHVAYTNDGGANWTTTSLGGYKGAAYGNGTFVIVGGDVKYTTDFSTWSNGSITSGSWIDVAFGNNTFVAIAKAQWGFAPFVAYSKDNGATWTDATTFTGRKLSSIAYGDGTFVIIGEDTLSAYSDDDGDNWTTIALPSSQTWTSVAYGNGTFVAICNSKAAYSTDKGRTWTQVDLPLSTNWQAITFGDGRFVAVASSADKPVLYSLDGIHWLQTSFNIPASYAVGYGNGVFMAAPTGSTSGQVITLANVYTETATPTTASTVYDAPEDTSTLTISSVGEGTITLSDTNTYTYNADGNAYSYYSVGESYPNYVCFIDGVGVKIGTTSIITVDQTYNATSANAQSGVAVNSVVGDIDTALTAIIAQGS